MTEPLSTKAGLDISEFKANISQLNRDMRVMSSEFKASAAALGDWSKDATGMEQRIGFLNKSIEAQQKKIENLQAIYKKQVTATGENSAAAQEWQIKINKATEDLNKMERELGEDQKALDGMRAETQATGQAVDTLGKETKETTKQSETFKNVLAGLSVALKVAFAVIMALVGAVISLAGGIGTLVFKTAESAAALNDLSLKTGVSTKRLQEFAYIADQVGTSQDTIVSSLTRLTRSMGEAAKQQKDFSEARAKAARDDKPFTAELGSAAAAFRQLGILVTDSSGRLRDNEDVFSQALSALRGVRNETERDALAMQIFGKSAQELNPLIKAGSAELARLSREANKVGAVISDENIQAFAEFQDELDSFKAGLTGTLGTLAAAFLPGFQAILGQLGGYLKSFSNIVKSADGDFDKIATGVAGLFGTIIKDIAAQAPAMLKMGLELFKTFAGAIVQALPTLIPVAVEIILSLVKFFIENLPAMIDAGIQLIVTLAQGLGDALPTLVPTMVQALVTIVQSLLKNLPMIIKAAIALILGLVKGLVVALPILLQAVPQIVQALSDALIIIAPLLLEAAVELIGILALGILQNIPVLLQAGGELIAVLLSHLLRLITEGVPKMAQAFVDGFKKGISDRWEDFVKYFTDKFKALWENIGNLFNPGEDAQQAGEQAAKDMAGGFKNEMNRLGSDLGGAFRSASNIVSSPTGAIANRAAASQATSAAGASGPGAASGASNFTINIYADGALVLSETKRMMADVSRNLGNLVNDELNKLVEATPA